MSSSVSLSSLSSTSSLSKVLLSPFGLATIILDNSNCDGDQEGFIIGNSAKNVRHEISDQSLCNTEEDLQLNVFSAFPSGKFMSFYDCRGVIDIDYVHKFLGERFKDVIGWYRYRRNVPTFPSAREGVIHRNLQTIFAGNLDIGDNFFIFACFGSSINDCLGTHSYDYAFFIERPDKFQHLPINMCNLFDTKTKYRNISSIGSFVNSRTFDSVLNIPWSFESSWQTEDSIQQIHRLLREKCANLGEELVASESVNAKIESDIKLLEKELAMLQTTDEQTKGDEELTKETVNPENVENIPPPPPPPQGEPSNRPIKKRFWSDVVDFELKKSHPAYGKYFERNRTLDQESQASSDGSDSSSCNVPPPKKPKVLQKNKRIIDHDYSSASDEDSHKYIQDMEDDRADDLDGFSLPSESEDYIQPDVPISQEVVVVSQKGEDEYKPYICYDIVEEYDESGEGSALEKEEEVTDESKEIKKGEDDTTGSQ